MRRRSLFEPHRGKTTNRFSPEVRTRAVRLVFEHVKDHPCRRLRTLRRWSDGVFGRKMNSEETSSLWIHQTTKHRHLRDDGVAHADESQGQRKASRVHPAGGLKEVPVRQSAYQAGYRAYNLGLGRCPHSRGSFLSQSWWGVGGTPSAPRGPPSATSFARPSPGRRTTPCSACEEAKIFAKKRPPKKGPARVGGRQVRAQQRGGEGRAARSSE